MKGILKNTKAGWFVLYQVMRDELMFGWLTEIYFIRF